MAFNANLQIAGLGSAQVTVPTAGNYPVSGTLTVPALQEGSASNSLIVTTVKLNGSTVFATNPGDRGFRCNVPCNASDIIQVVTSSSSVTIDGMRPRCTIAIG